MVFTKVSIFVVILGVILRYLSGSNEDSINAKLILEKDIARFSPVDFSNENLVGSGELTLIFFQQ